MEWGLNPHNPLLAFGPDKNYNVILLLLLDPPAEDCQDLPPFHLPLPLSGESYLREASFAGDGRFSSLPEGSAGSRCNSQERGRGDYSNRGNFKKIALGSLPVIKTQPDLS